MRGTFFVFSFEEIIDLAKECNLKSEEFELFKNYFDEPSDWIHALVEMFHDELAQQKEEDNKH